MALVGEKDKDTYVSSGSTNNKSGYSTTTRTTTNSQKNKSSSSSSNSSSSSSLDEFKLPDGVSIGGTSSNTSSTDSVDIYSLYSDYLAQQRAAAQASYERNINAINNAYGSARDYYNSNLNAAKNSLKTSYDASKKDIDSDAEASLREAYINNMLNRKNLQQALTAQGLNGGASETTQASMLNNYGSARNEIETQQAKSLAELLRNYNDNVASAQNAWSSQMASLELQKMQQLQAAENALNNMQTASLGNISTDSSYLTALKNLMNAQNAFSFSETVNPLEQALTDTTQGSSQADVNTDYQKYLSYQDMIENSKKNNLQALVQALYS